MGRLNVVRSDVYIVSGIDPTPAIVAAIVGVPAPLVEARMSGEPEPVLVPGIEIADVGSFS